MLFNLTRRNEKFDFIEDITIKDISSVAEAVYRVRAGDIKPLEVFNRNSLYAVILKITYQLFGKDGVELIESIRFNRFDNIINLIEVFDTDKDDSVKRGIELVKGIKKLYTDNIDNIFNVGFLCLGKTKEELFSTVFNERIGIIFKDLAKDICLEFSREYGYIPEIDKIIKKGKTVFDNLYNKQQDVKLLTSTQYSENIEPIQYLKEVEVMKEPELVIPLPGPVETKVKKMNKKEKKEFKTYDFSKLILIFNHYRQYGGYENVGPLYDPHCKSDKYKPFQYSIPSTDGGYKTIRIIPLKEDNKVMVKIFEMGNVWYTDTEIVSGEFLIGDGFVSAINRSLAGEVGFIVNATTNRIKLASNGVKNRAA